MSPNAEWGSSARLLERYLEMVGLDPSIPQKLAERPRVKIDTHAVSARREALVAHP
jgi:hypothetical protein